MRVPPIGVQGQLRRVEHGTAPAGQRGSGLIGQIVGNRVAAVAFDGFTERGIRRRLRITERGSVGQPVGQPVGEGFGVGDVGTDADVAAGKSRLRRQGDQPFDEAGARVDEQLGGGHAGSASGRWRRLSVAGPRRRVWMVGPSGRSR